MIIEWTEVPSPVGRLTLAAAESRLVALCFDGLWEKRIRDFEQRFENCRFVRRSDAAGAKSRLARYFDGDLEALVDLEVESHGTPFQQAVWRQLRLIPAGQTRTYGEIAAAIGAPTAVRAVGAANGANPIGIVVPCHRVIGSNGKLTGFAGGLASKRWLLDHESAQRRLPSRSAAA
ncbi:MAG: methylated-DNA--[protein]-cysteine S-methyltransferase [Candidatus Binatia bacterium]